MNRFALLGERSLRTRANLPVVIVLGLVVMTLMAMAVDTPSRTLAAPAGPVRIGVITGVTGGETATGEGTVRGVQIAVDEINADGGIDGRRLAVIVEDSESRPAIGVDAAHKLIDVNKVPLIICGCSSGILLPIGAYAKTQNVIIVNSSGSSPLIRQLAGTVFSVLTLDDIYSKFLAQWVYEKKFRSIAMLAPNTAYGVTQTKGVTEEFQRLGGRVVEAILYEQNQADYRPDLQRIQARRPEALVVAAFGDDSKLLFKQAIQIGLTVPWYVAYPTGLVIEDPTQAEGRIFGLDLGFNVPTALRFNAAYAKRYGRLPRVPNAVYTYDGVWLAALAMREGGTDPNRIRIALPRVAREYNGGTGKIIFDAQGQRVTGAFVKVRMTRDGTFVPTD